MLGGDVGAEGGECFLVVLSIREEVKADGMGTVGRYVENRRPVDEDPHDGVRP